MKNEKRPTLQEVRDLRSRLVNAEEKAAKWNELMLLLIYGLDREIRAIAEDAADEATGNLTINR